MASRIIFFLLVLAAGSVNKALSNADTVKIKSLIKEARAALSINPDSSFEMAIMIGNLSAREKFPKGEIDAYMIKARVYESKQDYNSAEKMYLAALEVATQNHLTQHIGGCNAMLGRLHIDRANYTKALQYNLTALSLYKKTNDNLKAGMVLNNIALIYTELNEYEKSIEYYKESIELKLLAGDTLSTATNYNNIGLAYTHLNMFDKGLEALKKSYKIKISYGEDDDTADNLVNMALAYEGKKDNSKAKEYYRRGLAILRKPNVSEMLISVPLNNLGKIYFDEGNFSEAEKLFLESAASAEKFETKENMAVAYQYLAETYKKINQYKEAINFFEKYKAVADSLAIEKSNESISEMRVKFDTENKEAENKLLRQQTELQQLKLRSNTILIIALSIILLFSIVVSLLLLRNKRLRTLQEKMLLEQKLLRSQMNPHFVFNAVNGIQSKILQKEEHEAYSYLTKFSQIIREILVNSHDDTISLSREIETLKLYIELEQLRFDNSFRFQLRVNDELNTDNIQIPSLIIQPFLENAIWHGLMPLNGLRQPKLELEFSKSANRIKVLIKDNGIGRKKSDEIKKSINHKSLGISLTSQRLELFTRQNNSIIISDLADKDGNITGTQVELLI